MLTTGKDTVIIRGSIEFDDDDTELPLGDLDIQVTADVGPEGKEDPGTSGYSGIPRFDSDPTDAVTVINVESDQTTLMSPYVIRNYVLKWDTGIVVSNMNTLDDQSGTVMFQLFSGGDMETIEPEGELVAGDTRTWLLSELLEGSVEFDDENFEGYMKVITNFTGAKGAVFVSDWVNISITGDSRRIGVVPVWITFAFG